MMQEAKPLCDDLRGGSKGGPSRRGYTHISIYLYISDSLHCAAEKLTYTGKAVTLQLKNKLKK